jgi:hypothetical protein
MTQGRIYTVSFAAVAVTAAVDIFELTPAANKPIQILGIEWGQTSDVGDAAAESLPYKVIRGHTTGGSGGAAPTPRPLSGSTTTAAGFAAETNNTTPASAGTPVDLHAGAINVQLGLDKWLPEGLEWSASAIETTVVVRLGAAPADSLTTSGTLYVRELG